MCILHNVKSKLEYSTSSFFTSNRSFSFAARNELKVRVRGFCRGRVQKMQVSNAFPEWSIFHSICSPHQQEVADYQKRSNSQTISSLGKLLFYLPAIELQRRRVFGLQVLDPRTTVADPSKFEVVPWLRELAFTVMKCKVFNTDL